MKLSNGRTLKSSSFSDGRFLSLDLYDQWKTMEEKNGKWRFTSPTHTVRAFARALDELEEEGGVVVRYGRYLENHRTLVEGMRRLRFRPLLPGRYQSSIITAFVNPTHPDYAFKKFYDSLKEQGFVIYPGKVTALDTFRIGHIGAVGPEGRTCGRSSKRQFPLLVAAVEVFEAVPNQHIPFIEGRLGPVQGANQLHQLHHRRDLEDHTFAGDHRLFRIGEYPDLSLGHQARTGILVDSAHRPTGCFVGR
ncbi:MAG: hypothetical protein ACLFQY_09380 [Desulfococcaceae bacterium]